MSVVHTFSTITNGDGLDAGKRLVSGLMDSGEPNNQGMLLDYASSKPFILKYIARAEKRSKGVSKGAVREMHKGESVGKIVEFDLDDSARALPITVHVPIDSAWQKIEERIYTGFSGGWNIVGKPWEDEALTRKHGRKIMRFTGDPVEVSLVDVPRVDGCEFQSIENADTAEGENMSTENQEPTPASESAPVAPEAPAQEAPVVVVENGLYTAGRLGESLEGISWISKVIAGEETIEGEGDEIVKELNAAIGAVAKVYAKYATKQAAELIKTGIDFDAFDVEDEIENGGEGATVQNGATKKSTPFSEAHKASVKAQASGDVSDHEDASSAHKKAAIESEKAGKVKMAKYHRAQQKIHKDAIANCNNGVPEVQNAATIEGLAALEARIAVLESRKVENALTVEAPAPAPANRPKPVAVFHDDDQSGKVQNGATIRPGMSLGEIEAAITEARNNR